MFENYTKRNIVYNDVYMGYIIDDYSIDCSNSKFDFIDKIYIISLEHRNDRREIVIENLKNIGINKVTFVVPLKFKDISLEDKKKLNGIFFENIQTEPINYTMAGCNLSHLISYKDLYSLGVKNCLILEDDCEFYNIPDETYIQIKTFITCENYDAFFLHCSYKREIVNKKLINNYIKRNILKNFNYDRLEIIKKYNDINIFFGTSLAHCIFYSSKFINFLATNLKIDIKKNTVKNIDYIIHIMGKTFDYYVTKQNYTTQFESFSDITICNVKKG